MTLTKTTLTLGVLAVLTLAGPVMAQTETGFIGGTTPSVRPAGAPVQGPLVKDAAWYAMALHGVEQPYPASLRFLEDQGRWFDPFIHPGMVGKYDIRHWHGDQ